MTDDNKSNGPYKETKWWTGSGSSTIEGPGFESLPQKVFKDLDMGVLLNLAYAEGVKAERERCAGMAKLNCTVEEIVDMIMGGTRWE
ncbi:MAG: hypothetical protein IPL32_19325 [Chloracidobacterium sp.]|nr:hypothetical protein [Chloracidobacterium sp.]